VIEVFAWVFNKGADLDDWVVFLRYVLPDNAGEGFEIITAEGIEPIDLPIATQGNLSYYGGGFWQESPRNGRQENEFAYSGITGTDTTVNQTGNPNPQDPIESFVTVNGLEWTFSTLVSPGSCTVETSYPTSTKTITSQVLEETTTVTVIEQLSCWLYETPVIQFHRGARETSVERLIINRDCAEGSTSYVNVNTTSNSCDPFYPSEPPEYNDAFEVERLCNFEDTNDTNNTTTIQLYSLDVQVTPDKSVFAIEGDEVVNPIDQPQPVMTGIGGSLYAFIGAEGFETWFRSPETSDYFLQLDFPEFWPNPDYSSLIGSIIYDSTPYYNDFLANAATDFTGQADSYDYLTTATGLAEGLVYAFGNPNDINIHGISYFTTRIPPNGGNNGGGG
jgi:hypothetical protein